MSSDRCEAYIMTIARAFVAAPDEECELGCEGGYLYDALCAACDRLGFEPQSMIDAAIEETRATQ